MMIHMVCPRDYTLRTKLGHTIKFKAGEPKPVPESIYHEAVAKNILPVKAVDNEAPAFELATGRVTGPLRDALIFEAIQALVRRNHQEDFTGGGLPKAIAVSKETGVDVTTQEMSNYWNRYKEIIAENSDFPSHPNVELVRELNALSSRKQLEFFAKDLGIDAKQLKGKALAEVKSLLLYQVVNNNQAPSASVVVDDDDYVKPGSLTED
jgi:hypothetical protein